MTFFDQAVTSCCLSYNPFPGKMEEIFFKDRKHFKVLVFYMGNCKYDFISNYFLQ